VYPNFVQFVRNFANFLSGATLLREISNDDEKEKATRRTERFRYRSNRELWQKRIRIRRGTNDCGRTTRAELTDKAHASGDLRDSASRPTSARWNELIAVVPASPVRDRDREYVSAPRAYSRSSPECCYLFLSHPHRSLFVFLEDNLKLFNNAARIRQQLAVLRAAKL